MHGETQANRLSKLMQKKGHLPNYELALPLVTVRSSYLEKLVLGDVLLLRLKHLKCILLDNGTICANVILVKHNNRHAMKIVTSTETKLKPVNSKKYEEIKLLLGTVHSRTLTIGHMIDITQINLKRVALIAKDNKIATASLVNVDGEIAVKIDKVKKDEYTSDK